jgi:methionyl aminopeptidase
MAFREKNSKIIIKSEEQIAGIRKASKIAGNALNAVAPFVKAGVTTAYLNKICADYLRDHHAKSATLGYHGYPAESCISVNDVICHGIPGPYLLKDGDILNIDVTAILDGYYGDTSKMYTVGEITPHAKQLITVTKKCLDIGIAQCKPGNHIGDIGYEIHKYASSFGYGVVYEFCGHGVGLKFHEEPEICHVDEKGTGAVLKPGMTFTIEPMINAGKARAKVDKKDGWTARTIDGKLSAQFEHTILVTSSIPEILTDVDGTYEVPEKIF